MDTRMSLSVLLWYRPKQLWSFARVWNQCHSWDGSSFYKRRWSGLEAAVLSFVPDKSQSRRTKVENVRVRKNVVIWERVYLGPRVFEAQRVEV